ncbi:MAG: histidine kinase, partial [Gemmatimonadetes bacterium]|nr:histidine kinase [Gemmatimonadota bacterium]
MTRARVPLRPYLLAWFPFVPVYTLAVHLSGASWLDSALSAVSTVGIAAALGVGVARWRPTGWAPGALLRHVLLGGAYAGLWTGFIAAEIAWGAPADRWEGFLANAIRWQFVTGLILYVLLVVAFTSLDRLAALRAQEQRAARAEADRVRAELQALRAQLNPHFLFNTLHSITALVRADPTRAEGALERLAACLRRVLEVNAEGNDQVALGDELAFVRDYLALERLRHGERLRVVEEVDPDLLDAPILPFLLQPLVENAIKHGMAPITRPVTIRISAR